MKEEVRFLGMDVHAETISVAVAEADGEVRSLGTIAQPRGVDPQADSEVGICRAVASLLLGRSNGLCSLLAVERTWRRVRRDCADSGPGQGGRIRVALSNTPNLWACDENVESRRAFSGKRIGLRDDCHATAKDPDSMTGLDDMKGISCKAFTSGVIEGWELAGRHICVPDGVTILEEGAVVGKYLDDHPKELHLEPAVLVIKAVRQARPCGK